MIKINWKVRAKSLQFWLGLVGVIVSPILAYFGMAASDFTTWQSIGDIAIGFVSNPYLVFTVITSVLSFIGVATDPTTKGISDSTQALTYDTPKVSK